MWGSGAQVGVAESGVRRVAIEPIVVDGIMYVTERPNSVMAVDAITGRVFWKYTHTPDERARVCCGANNRGSRFWVMGVYGYP